MEMEAIEATPDSLFRGGIEVSPVSLAPYLRYATWLDRQGRGEEAYQLLAEEALPWGNHRGTDWRQHRLELATRLVRGAIEKNDAAILSTPCVPRNHCIKPVFCPISPDALSVLCLTRTTCSIMVRMSSMTW